MSGAVKLLRGYGSILNNATKKILTALKILLFLFFVFALSLGIVYPLWFLATNSAHTYTLFVIFAFLVLIVAFFCFRFTKMLLNHGIKESYRSYILPKFIKLGKVLVISFSVMFLIFIFAYSKIYGIIITTLLLILYGYFRFVYKK